MTPIGQLVRVAQRNTEKETGMWITQNTSFLIQKEKDFFHQMWEMSQRGVSFEEAYNELSSSPHENDVLTRENEEPH